MTTAAQRSRTDSSAPEPGLDDVPRYALAIGVVLVLLVPAARGFSDTFGWMPLWLLAMPLSAWWALHRFRLPYEPARGHEQAQPRRRRTGLQARRRKLPAVPRRQPQAA
ncbi:hypothetical protein ACFOLC_06055 [Lysobacter cavernae]|uniref:Transmembrane protein n=1 Tax=Lysobacter cavernae TaxID=1685901 RepID=A0ABV7RP95_9GAMM